MNIFVSFFFYKNEKNKIIVLKVYWLEHLYWLILFEEHNSTLHMTMLVSFKNNNNITMLASKQIAWAWYWETKKCSEGHGIQTLQRGSVPLWKPSGFKK